MVEGRRGPRLESVAASARLGRRAMKIVIGDSCGMAFAAGRKNVAPEQVVREGDIRSGTPATDVIAMTLNTSRLGQGLMKCRTFRNADNGVSGRCAARSLRVRDRRRSSRAAFRETASGNLYSRRRFARGPR